MRAFASLCSTCEIIRSLDFENQFLVTVKQKKQSLRKAKLATNFFFNNGRPTEGRNYLTSQSVITSADLFVRIIIFILEDMQYLSGRNSRFLGDKNYWVLCVLSSLQSGTLKLISKCNTEKLQEQ